MAAELKIEKKHIAEMKKAGMMDGHSVSLLKTFGGLHIVATMIDGKAEILAFASHPAIAKYKAEQATTKKITWIDE